MNEKEIGLFGHKGCGKTTYLTALFQLFYSRNKPKDMMNVNFLDTFTNWDYPLTMLKKNKRLASTTQVQKMKIQFNVKKLLLKKKYLIQIIDMVDEKLDRNRLTYLKNCDGIILLLEANEYSIQKYLRKYYNLINKLMEDTKDQQVKIPIAIVITKWDKNWVHKGRSFNEFSENNIKQLSDLCDGYVQDFKVWPCSSLKEDKSTGAIKIAPSNVLEPFMWHVGFF